MNGESPPKRLEIHKVGVLRYGLSRGRAVCVGARYIAEHICRLDI